MPPMLKKKYTFLTKKTVGETLAKNVKLQVTEDEADIIVAVGLLFRKYILASTYMEQKPVDGSFDSSCLREPVTQPLLTLIDTLLEGSKSMKDQLNKDDTVTHARLRIACTISQLQQRWAEDEVVAPNT